MSRYPKAAWLLLLAGLIVPVAHADDDDTQFLLDQTRRAAEQKTQQEDTLATPPGTLLYEGQVYQVPSQLESLEPAIYVAINSNQWTQLPDFLTRYQQLPGHRPALVAMAKSLQARFNGDYPTALRLMQDASQHEPDDARIRLEIARLWFEDNQDKKARAGFASALEVGMPSYAQALIEQYNLALDQRAEWQGSAAVGFGYNDNINQGNGYYSCLSSFAGICFFERKMPDPIESAMYDYEVSLQKRFNLAGNHNVQVRPTSYGNYYSRTNPESTASIKDYSTNLAILQAGYQYLNARDNLSLMPYVEHYYRNRNSEYVAHGVLMEWRRSLTRKWQIGTSFDAKRYEYTTKGQLVGADYKQYKWNLTSSYMLQANTSVYGGLTLGRNKYEVDQASSKDWSVRGGVYHAFNGRAGAFVNAVGIYRESRNDAFDGFLGARRHDKQQVYILSAGANAWQIAGVTPELRVRHSINDSNLDWAFGFDQTEISLMLRRSF